MTHRLAAVSGRPVLVDADGGWHDIAAVTGADPDSEQLYDAAHLGRVDALLAGRSADGDFEAALAAGQVDAPTPRVRNCFAIGLNYADHAAESQMDAPDNPLVFTKFPSCIVGPNHDVVLGSDFADWEVELVVVIGASGRDIDAADAWDHVLGLTVGQDVSDRVLQFAAKPPHFDLGKSRDTYGPIGPMIVSTDLVDDPGDLVITCDVNGVREQSSRTSNMIFDVPTLIAYLSSIMTLGPGDLIFTGTPDGIGAAKQPPTFLRPGDTMVSTIDGLGTITNTCR